MAVVVFIVEDNEDIAFILNEFLSEEGFVVRLFPNIAAFQAIFPAQIPDVILLDVMLPDGDGLTLCNQIKSNPAVQHVPVLIMSAHSPAEKIANDSLANGFIRKPFDLDDVKYRLINILPAKTGS